MGSKKKNKVIGGDSADDGENGKGKQIIADPRFSKVHSDPRFQKLPKHKAKVAIDERFNRMFTDKRFAGSSAPLDKRGKPKKHSENVLRRYYRQEEDEEQENRKKREKLSESESSDGSSESESESDLDSDVSTSTTDTDDEADDADMTEGDASDEVENVPLIEKETHRLAVVNMDWSQVKAVDLFVMLGSFLPKGGQIKSVAVYPSEFGLQRMQEEAVRGPALLFDDEKKDNDNEEEEDDDEIDTEKLRAYEKSRLRYYYAVVECDSVATADYLYKTCDEVEFERSSNVLDLRFIPDSMEFKHPPRDVAKEAPTDYDGLDFHTRALQHSNVLLSWDDDEPHRLKKLRRKYTEEQLAELELNEFLASEESENDEDENDNEDASGKREKKLEMYRALVQSGDGSEEDDDDGQDMEVTFNTGLEDLSNKILQKKDKGSETVWEAYLRKRKEKKKARKSRSKNSSDDESDESDQEPPEQPDDFFEEEPPGERAKKVSHPKKNRKKESLEKAAEASRAELELLLADENGDGDKVKGYKIKQRKGKNGKEALDEEKIPTVDDDDRRFSALFTNPGFALDPTDPQFKRSAPYFRQLAQKQQKGREERHTDNGPMELPKGTSSDSVENEKKQAIDTSKKEKNELSTIVKSLKMKSQQISVPASVKSKKEKMGSTVSAAKEKKHNLPSLDRPKKKKVKV